MTIDPTLLAAEAWREYLKSDEARSHVEDIVRPLLDARLADVPTNEKLVEIVTRMQREHTREVNQIVHGVDETMRQALAMMSIAHEDMKTARDEMRVAAQQMGTSAARFEGKSDVVGILQNRTEAMQRVVLEHDSALEALRRDGLEQRRMLFGDPERSDVPSVMSELHEQNTRIISAVRLLSDEMQRSLQGVSQQMGAVSERLTSVEQFVSRRRAVENAVLSALSGGRKAIAAHRRIVLILGLGGGVLALLGLPDAGTWVQALLDSLSDTLFGGVP